MYFLRILQLLEVTHKTLYTNVCEFFGRTTETHRLSASVAGLEYHA